MCRGEYLVRPNQRRGTSAAPAIFTAGDVRHETEFAFSISLGHIVSVANSRGSPSAGQGKAAKEKCQYFDHGVAMRSGTGGRTL